jgi:hypothetical protein
LDLNEIRNARNVLVHQSSFDALKDARRFALTDDRLVLNREHLGWTDLILTAIAHGIAEDIEGDKLRPKASL